MLVALIKLKEALDLRTLNKRLIDTGADPQENAEDERHTGGESNPDATEAIHARALQHCFLVFFFLYPSLSTTCFNALSCRDFGDESWHSQDLTINCDSTEYGLFFTVALVFIGVYPLGVPAFFAWLLYINRKELATDSSDHIAEQQFAPLLTCLLGEEHDGYSEEDVSLLFNAMDTDGDGYISREELTTFAMGLGLQGMRKQRAEEGAAAELSRLLSEQGHTLASAQQDVAQLAAAITRRRVPQNLDLQLEGPKLNLLVTLAGRGATGGRGLGNAPPLQDQAGTGRNDAEGFARGW